MKQDPAKQAADEKKKREQEFNDFLAGSPQWRQLADQLSAQAGDRPGLQVYAPSANEQKAGVNPPGYEGTRDVKTGQLLDQYKTNPYGGEALQALKQQAFAEGMSPWAQAQMKSQALQQQDAKSQAMRQQMTAQSGAQSQIARSGGLTGGASALLVRQGARDLLNSQQGISRAGMGQRLGIEQQDIDRKNQLLGTFGDLENQANQSNLNQATGDINRKAMFDMERYRQQMQAWGAQQSADATRAAGGGGGKK